MELEELHVLKRQAAPVQHRRPVAGQRVGVGGDLEHLAETAGAEDQRLGPEHVQLAGCQLVGDHPGGAPGGQQHVQHVELVEEGRALLDVLLVERLQDHVAGAVRREAGAAHGPPAVVVGVAAEAPLVDPAVGRAVERHAHVLEVVDRVDRLAAHDLGGVLVDQVVAALDGVERVPLPVVLLDAGQRRAHAALRGARVRARRVQLGEHGRLRPRRRLQRRAEPGSARTDDHHVVGVPHCHRRQPLRVKMKIVSEPSTQVRPMTVRFSAW
jgi:hypothetical protein